MGIKSYDERKDLCKHLNVCIYLILFYNLIYEIIYLKTRRCSELPIHTFYNDGVGKHYFIEGVN